MKATPLPSLTPPSNARCACGWPVIARSQAAVSIALADHYAYVRQTEGAQVADDRCVKVWA